MSDAILDDRPASADAPPADAPIEPRVGEILRQAREARGLTLADVATTLKLGERQLDALERNDWQSLPGTTFIRGFVRNYARLLQLNPVPLMAALDAMLERPTVRLDIPHSASGEMPQPAGYGIPRKEKRVILAGVALVLLAIAVYFLLPGDISVLRGQAQTFLDSLARKEASAVPASDSAAKPAADPVLPPNTTVQQVMHPAALPPSDAAVPAAAVPPAQAVADLAPLRFVIDRQSWVEVKDRDQNILFSQRLEPGIEQPVEGKGPFSIVVGFAPGVRLFWMGKPVDLTPHTRGDVARLILE